VQKDAGHEAKTIYITKQNDRHRNI
jgi:hypothetical protein